MAAIGPSPDKIPSHGSEVKGKQEEIDQKLDALREALLNSVKDPRGCCVDSPISVQTLQIEGVGTYFGEVVSREPHGKGVMTFADGSEWAGAWFRGRKHGEGVLTKVGGRQVKEAWAADYSASN